jgi:hypothetical protein
MNRNEPFAAFCNRIAAHVKVRIPDGNYTLPEEYNESAEKLLAAVMKKKSSFSNFPYAGIQSRFDNMDEVRETLEKKTVDGEIPDSVITFFAYYMYSKFEYDEEGNLKPEGLVAYNNLPESAQNIIKVVSAYFMLHY